MIKISEKVLKKHIPNIIISVMLLCLFSLSVLTNTSVVFNKNYYAPIYYGNKDSNNISLMFNVYWGTEYIPQILKILDKYNIKSTFFIGGSWAVKNEEVLTNIYKNGHEIGNHGYWHKDHKNITVGKNKEEILLTHKVIESFIGYKMNLFAPPSGSFDEKTLNVAKNLGYKTIMWSVDTIDWRDKNSELIYKRATKNCKGGNLILMHPTKDTLIALPKIISFYNTHGYKLTTVSKNIL